MLWADKHTLASHKASTVLSDQLASSVFMHCLQPNYNRFITLGTVDDIVHSNLGKLNEKKLSCL